MNSPSFRLAIVLSHPTQYYSPWFRWLRARTPLTFKVFYLWEFGVSWQPDPQFQRPIKWDVDLLSGYDSEFVANTAPDPGTHHFWGLRNPRLTPSLAAWRPDAVLLFGYPWAAHVRTIFWARRRKIPLIFRGDSHLLGRPSPTWRRALPLKWLYRQFKAVTYVGMANRAYFRTLGVPDKRLFFAPHSVDDSLFDPASPNHRVAASDLRKSLGIAANVCVVLFAGKFVPGKQPRELLAAFLSLNLPETALVFVGDGEEKAQLEIAASKGAGSVYFLPFANQTEMPARYLMSDLFVLPSRGLYETWGLAVNEAMMMGIPCLVSERVGCQQDLVTSGETGWVFQSEDPADLGRQLRLALGTIAQSDKKEKLRDAIKQRITGYTYRQTTEGLTAALASLSQQR